MSDFVILTDSSADLGADLVEQMDARIEEILASTHTR